MSTKHPPATNAATAAELLREIASKQNRCEFCGRDCSFLAEEEGACMSCGAILLGNPRHMLRNLVAGSRQLMELSKANQLLLDVVERLLKLRDEFESGSCDFERLEREGESLIQQARAALEARP